MNDIIDHNLFILIGLWGFAIVGALVSIVLSMVALSRWLNKRAARLNRENYIAERDRANELIGKYAAHGITTGPIGIPGRTHKSQAIAAADKVLAAVDEA